MSKLKQAHNLRDKWRSWDVRAEENISFSALLLSERVLKGLKGAGFRKPSPVQFKAIPLARCGVDLIVQAKSGTGKTLVFSVVALECLMDIPNLQALILAPTREVAHQICDLIISIGSGILNLGCHVFIGGTSVSDDVKKLKRCQIAVGTPGRIKNLIEMKAMLTGCVRLLVLDEADKLMSHNFREDIKWINNHLPIYRKQVLAFSATYPDPVMECLKDYMKNPSIMRIETELTLKGLLQFYLLSEFHPLPAVTYKRKREIIWEIVNKVSFSQCMIFCNTIARVELLCEWLNSQGYPTSKITSCDDQTTRLQTIEKLKSFQCRILVTSDLAARGIDAKNVDFVINADLADNLQTHVHRIGRAGRYGTKATAVTIITTGFEEQKLGVFEEEGNFKVYPLPDPIPDELLMWTTKMVKASKIKDSKQCIKKLERISFTGSSEAKYKNGHVSDDNLESDNSLEISDESVEGRKENSQNNPSVLCSDEPVCESSLTSTAASNNNDNDVKVLHASSSASIEQGTSSHHSESSTVKDFKALRKVIMCSSDATSSKTYSKSNTGAEIDIQKTENICKTVSHVECSSDNVCLFRAADSMLEATSENDDKETFSSIMPKVGGQIAATGDIPLDPKIQKRRMNVHNQQFSVKSDGRSKSCLTDNSNKHDKLNRRLLNKRPVSDRKESGKKTVSNQTKLLKKNENRNCNVKEPLTTIGHGQQKEHMHYQRHNVISHRLSHSQYSNSHTNMPIHNVCSNGRYCSCKQKFLLAQKDECQYYERHNHNLPHSECDAHNFRSAKHNISMCHFHRSGCDRQHCIHPENYTSCCCNPGKYSCAAAYDCSHNPAETPCCHYGIDSDVNLPYIILDSVNGRRASLFTCGHFHDLGRDLHEDLITLMSSKKQF